MCVNITRPVDLNIFWGCFFILTNLIHAIIGFKAESGNVAIVKEHLPRHNNDVD